MSKNWKIIITVSFGALFILGLSLIKEETDTSTAYGQTMPEFPLGQPIPTGEAIEETIAITDFIYQGYKRDLVPKLDTLISSGQELVDNLNKNPDICDWSVCRSRPRATLVEVGPEIIVNECLSKTFDYGCEEAYRICANACRDFECEGDPCSLREVKTALADFKNLQAALTADFDAMNYYFNGLQAPITKDIELEEDIALGRTVTTTIGHAQRKFEAAQVMLEPGEWTCMPNAQQRELEENGELTKRRPELCTKALTEGYWPDQSSEWCESKCQYGLTDECRQCLTTNCDEETQRKRSWLADINCTIFKDCATECVAQGALDEQCYQCLCQRFQDEKDPDGACLDWICGGSYLNFVCQPS